MGDAEEIDTSENNLFIFLIYLFIDISYQQTYCTETYLTCLLWT